MIRTTRLIYFSATGTTARIVSAIGEGIGNTDTLSCALLSHTPADLSVPPDEIAVFGVPVFSGRIPAPAREALEKIKGDHTPAVIACVYGNRDYDDALRELSDIVTRNGFRVLSAGAFIGQHSIFPDTGRGRPDMSDLAIARKFGTDSLSIALQNKAAPCEIKGSQPYRKAQKVPLYPSAGKKCNRCGICAGQCPTQAIDPQNPPVTDKRKCISCAHCITVCPRHARKFHGLLYRLVSRKFVKKYSLRKEPELFFSR